MARIVRWLARNADGVLALVIAAVIGLLMALDVVGANQVSAAILVVLGLLAATLLRDRKAAVEARQTATAVRLLSGADIGQEHAAARNETELWIFKGGTGTYLRAVTLKECVANARRERRPLRIQLEIIDPINEQLCREYAQFRSSLAPGPDGTGESWTFERTRKEAFATVLAACWYQQRFPFLTVELGLARVMSTFRWDMSSRSVIMTQEDPAGPALVFERGKPYYRAYSRELVASFRQARRVEVDRPTPELSEEPTVDEVRTLFHHLDLALPSSFTDRDVTDIIRKALRAKNPY